MTEHQEAALATAGEVMPALSRGDRGALETVLYWLPLLSEPDQALCRREIQEGTRLARRTGRLEDIADLLYGREATGLAAWDRRRAQQRGDTDDWEPVPLDRPAVP